MSLFLRSCGAVQLFNDLQRTLTKILLVIRNIFAILLNMRLANIRKFCHLLALFLLVFQFCGLIFCGDADCLQGGSTENCVALICNLLGKHSVPASTADNTQSSSCQCYCHGLIDLPKITLDAVPFATAPFHANEALHLVSSPVRSIYHPPLA